ncbi:MAG: hypothetical protein CMJ78_09675 [Planctomycetaceae bacterium]|nr:hypothetical protein [Planctomycetaceae bacterium]
MTQTLPSGFDPQRFQFALDELAGLCDRNILPAAGLAVGRRGEIAGPYLFGRQTLTTTETPIREDAIFLIASITKPLVAMGVLMLIERGHLTMGDRVSEFIPEFPKNGKNGVTVRNLLTHTSGLPDMLANNVELRAAGAPLSAFVRCTCEIKLDFPAGRGVQYQSMGFAILGEIIQRISGKTCANFLFDEFFEPLGMNDTRLGSPDDWYEGTEPVIDRIAEIRLPKEQDPSSSWNWNGRYWRSLGAPWGGLLTTPTDLAKYAMMMRNGGELDGRRYLSPGAVAAATRNQTEAMKEVPEPDRRCRPWGIGWRLHWPAHSANFGDLLGPRTFGHWGATGTVLWIDPDTDAFAVLLTTQPQEPHGSQLSRVSNLIAASIA